MKKYIPVSLGLLFLVLMAPQAFGETIYFGDSTIYWAQPLTTWASSRSGLNTADVYGTPDIKGGSAEITNGYLTNLTFEVQSKRYYDWAKLKPADLFIDIQNDDTWDFVVNMITAGDGLGDKGLYAISQGLTDPGYIMAFVPGVAPTAVRDNHPIGYENGVYQSAVGFDGWPGWGDPSFFFLGLTYVSFDFAQNGIYLGDQSDFAIGWTVNCANDVIHEVLEHQVPEPATLLLLGFGIIGLAGMGRKRFFARQND